MNNSLRDRFIRLRELAHIPTVHINEYSILYESPQRIMDINTKNLDSTSGNYDFTLTHKKNSKITGKYKDYNVYSYISGDLVADAFIRGNKTDALFIYEKKSDTIIEHRVWQDFVSVSLCRNIIFDHYFKKCKQIISDDSHTEYGEKYWKKLIEESLKRKFKVFALCGDEVEPITSVEDSDIYFGFSSEYKDVRLSIKK